MMHEGRTLPVGAVPARLLRSGEYTIRGVVDLNACSGLKFRRGRQLRVRFGLAAC